ncbi:DUF4920 domain-containing protein [Lacinutrix sp. C3R15]|uniref:DUF4920 domain-containing protein n=1 Tax=Flavobacteriaceae TaxID=49546 RepID=UPI001C08A7E2|nr:MULTISPECIES: DUF4920 domain-containing protein [Flavobacteriaceae]MBU2940246.1 DUF4920 domain-containing protein [Lacinutrix sp. C3R15]MDO6623564.1 DUF4920 domain-containing protein [Oceanihabitans sp. 1_MG-2023]
MKKIIFITMLLSVFLACKEETKKENVETEAVKEISYASFGKEIKADDAISSASMAAQYKKMQVGDSINSKMIAKVDEVCQAKGCWMKLNLDNGEQVMVKFKDYGFFMPKNIAGQEVIINGKAYVNEVPVEELRHYAADAGKSEEEIAQITAPEKTYSFEADGVLIVQE